MNYCESHPTHQCWCLMNSHIIEEQYHQSRCYTSCQRRKNWKQFALQLCQYSLSICNFGFQQLWIVLFCQIVSSWFLINGVLKRERKGTETALYIMAFGISKEERKTLECFLTYPDSRARFYSKENYTQLLPILFCIYFTMIVIHCPGRRKNKLTVTFKLLLWCKRNHCS